MEIDFLTATDQEVLDFLKEVKIDEENRTTNVEYFAEGIEEWKPEYADSYEYVSLLGFITDATSLLASVRHYRIKGS